MSKPKISILLPAYKSEELLKKVFLPSFYANSQRPVEVIFYDNGGNGNIRTAMSIPSNREKGLEKDFKVIGDGRNIGLNAALNACAEAATGDYYYLCHTDMFLLPGWDTALLDAVKNHPPGKQLLCSRSIEKSSHTPFHVLKDFGTSIENFKEKELCEFFKTYKDNGIVTAYRMPFFMHKKVWKDMEKFNESFIGRKEGVDSHYFSFATDNDIFFTAHAIGIRQFWMVNASVVYHLSGHSNNQQSVDKDSKEPYHHLIKKWSKRYNIDMNIDESEQQLIPWNVKVR